MEPAESIKAYLEKTKPIIDREIEKLIPRRMDASSLAGIFGRPRYVYDHDSLTKSLSEPVWDLLDRGGKRWRPALFLLIVEALGKNPAEWADIAAITEVVHNGCLPADTKIMRNPGEYVNISDVKKGDFVFCFGDDGKIARRRVLASRFTGNRKLFSLKTRNREIMATENHPFLVVEKDQPIRYKITASGRKRLYKILKRGDLNQICQKLNMGKTLLSNKLSLKMPNLMEKEMFNFIFDYFGLSVRKSDFEERKTKYQSPVIRLVWRQLKDINKGDIILVLRKGLDKQTPSKFPIPPKDPPKDRAAIPEFSTKEFCQIFGYILGDGSVTIDKKGSRLYITPSNRKDERTAYTEIFNRIFKYKLKKETQDGYERLVCCSYKICWLLKNLGLHKKATQKTIPEWIFRVPEEQKLAFIRGYLDSDGSVAKNGIVSFACASEKLIKNLKILLDGLGFTTGNIYYRKVRNLWKSSIKKESDQWHISVSSPNEFLKRVGTERTDYKERLALKRKSPLFKYSRSIPNVPIDPERFRLDRVVGIEPGNTEPVYDLMIERSHNFIANNMIVHNSLIIDDVEDMGELRRGKPCTHKIFGEDIAINAGNFMYYAPAKALMMREIDRETMKRAYDAYLQEMINLGAGQGMDIWWHKGKNPKVTEEQYLQMVAYKTGTLARMAARLAVIVSGGTPEQEEKIGALAEALGIGFQIQDDVLDIVSSGEEREKFGKTFGNDITEGKRTLMVIRTLHTSDDATKKRLLEILDSHTRDRKLINEAINLIKKSGSVEYARKKGNDIVEKAWKEVGPLLPDSGAKKTMKALIDFSVSRKH